MGQKFYDLYQMESHLHWVVYQVLWGEIEEKLQKRFKNDIPGEVFTIDICGDKYYVKTDDQYRYGSYKKFKLAGLVTGESIKI